MSTIAFDQFALTRIADFARSLSRLHQVARRHHIDDDQIDREFNAVCLSVWGYTTDDFSDELFELADHAWLDSLDEAHARIFAAEQGYDLIDQALWPQYTLYDLYGSYWMTDHLNISLALENATNEAYFVAMGDANNLSLARGRTLSGMLEYKF